MNYPRVSLLALVLFLGGALWLGRRCRLGRRSGFGAGLGCTLFGSTLMFGRSGWFWSWFPGRLWFRRLCRFRFGRLCRFWGCGLFGFWFFYRLRLRSRFGAGLGRALFRSAFMLGRGGWFWRVVARLGCGLWRTFLRRARFGCAFRPGLAGRARTFAMSCALLGLAGMRRRFGCRFGRMLRIRPCFIRTSFVWPSFVGAGGSRMGYVVMRRR